MFLLEQVLDDAFCLIVLYFLHIWAAMVTYQVLDSEILILFFKPSTVIAWCNS